jgi:hypothetical protein
MLGAAATGQGSPAMVRWSFLLFVFTVPFEAADMGFTSSSLSLSKISGLFFFACYFFHYNPLLSHLPHRRSFPRPPQATWWFLGYVAIFTLNGYFIPATFRSNFLSFLFTRVQLIFIFWITASLLEKEKMARQAVLMFAIASSIMALGILFHLPGFAESKVMQGDIERATALGYNPNTLGGLLALALVMLIGLRLNDAFKHFVSKLSLLALGLPLVAGLVKTGSRGAIAMAMLGLSAYLLPFCRSHRKVTAIVLALLGMVAVVYTVIRSPSALLRWQQTYYEGRLSSRERIFPAAVAMIWERPIFGWQPGGFELELGQRSGHGKRIGSHNLYLQLFLEVGMVGAVPFLIGLWLCGQAAWRARMGNLGLLPLALLLTALIENMNNAGLSKKPLWLVLALTIAGASIAAQGQSRGTRRLVVRQSVRRDT